MLQGPRGSSGDWATAAARARGDSPPSPTAVAELIAARMAPTGRPPRCKPPQTHPAHPPEELSSTICRIFSCSKHQFANPSLRTPVDQHWGDSSSADQWFGCYLGTYTACWTGASLGVHAVEGPCGLQEGSHVGLSARGNGRNFDHSCAAGRRKRPGFWTTHAGAQKRLPTPPAPAPPPRAPDARGEEASGHV
jgi:hypothetical protein